MKYYGVKKGRTPGIYTSWEECKKQVDKYHCAQYKSFASKKEAEEYMGFSGTNVSTTTDSTYIVAYTDGACSGNGTEGARAGIGVYFPNDEYPNISAPFDRERPSNQRAEVLAIIQTMRATVHGDIEILTDSMYTINAMTDWIFSWLKNNWNGDKVVNRDLLEELYLLIKNRKGKVKFTHVDGHAGIPGNEMADSLAVAGARM